MTKSGEFLLDPTQQEEQVKLLLGSGTCCCVLNEDALHAIVNLSCISTVFDCMLNKSVQIGCVMSAHLEPCTYRRVRPQLASHSLPQAG